MINVPCPICGDARADGEDTCGGDDCKVQLERQADAYAKLQDRRECAGDDARDQAFDRTLRGL